MVDITKTRAQLLERAGINLGLVQPGEALSSEDYNTLDNLVDPLIEQLTADNVIYIKTPTRSRLRFSCPWRGSGQLCRPELWALRSTIRRCMRDQARCGGSIRPSRTIRLQTSEYF
jgi:hypothetical protein